MNFFHQINADLKLLNDSVRYVKHIATKNKMLPTLDINSQNLSKMTIMLLMKANYILILTF